MPSSHICNSEQGFCPTGFVDFTNGHANHWACGSGCAGGLYTNGVCTCACQPIGCVGTLTATDNCATLSEHPCPPGGWLSVCQSMLTIHPCIHTIHGIQNIQPSSLLESFPAFNLADTPLTPNACTLPRRISLSLCLKSEIIRIFWQRRDGTQCTRV